MLRGVSGKAVQSFITTPIFYVNGPPHLGHLYTVVLADAQNRFLKLVNPDASHVFTTGTDEYGLKVEQAAAAAEAHNNQPTNTTTCHFDTGKEINSIKSYCDSVSNQFRKLISDFKIGNTDFVRTTQERHALAVTTLWNHLRDRDLIYLSEYEGWYSVPDESFIPHSQVIDVKLGNGETIKVSSESGHPVQWTNEQNYLFRLERFRDDIKRWIEKDDAIHPKQFVPPIMKWLDTCQDLSISRPRSRLTWGIPVPGDRSQVIYVWFDALVNYLTVAGYPSQSFKNVWPPTVQVVGKDILKFHSIYWPGVLLGSGLDLPHKIICHSHWTVDNVKMSKSLGNVIDPFSLMDTYGLEAVRYFLLREGVPHSDGNFNETKLIQMVNAELADTLGNLLSRSSSRALNPNQIWPGFRQNEFRSLISQHGHALKTTVEGLPGKVKVSFQEFNYYRGIEHIMSTLRLANAFVQEVEPWKLVKISSEEPALRAMICIVLETLRVIGIMLQPIVPSLSGSLLDKLNVPLNKRLWCDIEPFCWNKCDIQDMPLVPQSLVIFSRIKI